MSDFVKDINVSTNDCISRQAAIELKPEFLNPNVNRETEEQTAIDRAYARGWNSCNTHWIDKISELPSAQPKIIRCKDCKWWSNDDYRECSNPNYDDGYVTPAGFYCGYAERKDDE